MSNVEIMERQLQQAIDREQTIIESAENQKIQDNYKEIQDLDDKQDIIDGLIAPMFEQEKQLVKNLSNKSFDKNEVRKQLNEVYKERIKLSAEKAQINRRVGFLLGEIKAIQQEHNISRKINDSRAIQKKIKKILSGILNERRN